MVDYIKQDMTDIWASSGDITSPSPEKIATGWVVEAVPRQWWNWFENRQDTNIAYILQKGLPEWDIVSEYLTNKSYVQRNGVVYKCILTNSGLDPATSPANWVKAFPESSASLEALRVITPAANTFVYFTSPTAAATSSVTAYARTLLDDVDAAAARTTLQAQLASAVLTTLATLTPATNKLPYFTGTSSATTTDLTSFARSLLDDNDAATARTTLGVYSSAESDAALTAGLATKQPLATNLTNLAALTITGNTIPFYDGSSALGLTPVTTYGRGFLNLADASASRGYIGADNASNLTSGTIALARLPVDLTGINAATATKLQTARTIQGVAFDGTANITLSVVDKDSATGSAALPAGTSAQRTASPANGMLRYNSETNEFEGYQNGAWAGIGGGTPLYTVLWWPNRASIPAGYIPADGQLLTRTSYQAAFAGVDSGILPVVSDATWLATSTSRGCYTTGNGTTTFRIPDLNGKTAGTTAAPFLRGDGTNSTGVAGNFQASANLSHTHTFQSNAGAIKNTYPTVSLGFTGTGYADAGSPAVLLASGDVESRPVNVTGVFVIKLIGGASELSQDDASVAVAALEDKLQFVSGRNRIINGDCQVSQKATVSVTTGVTAFGGADRWRAVNAASAGGAFSQARSTMVHDGITKFTIRQTVTTVIASRTGGNYWNGLNQLIEGRNCYDFLGKNITASFVFNTNVSGTYSVSLRDSSSKSYVTTFDAVANTPVKVEISASVPADANIPNTSAAGFQIVVGALNTGTYQTSSLNGWQAGTFLSADTATNWGATNGNFIEMTDVQIELGTQATPFERLIVSVQLAQCQRYYNALSNVFYYVDYAGFAGTGFAARQLLPVTMREVPSVTVSGVTSTNLATSSVSCESTSTIRISYSNSAVGNVVYGVGTVTLDAEI
jgi:hypothetical protein